MRNPVKSTTLLSSIFLRILLIYALGLLSPEWQFVHTMDDPKHKDAFKSVNYTDEEEPFVRLKKIMIEKRLHVIHGDLMDSRHLRSLRETLQGHGLKISAIDISNAWGEFMIQRRLAPLLEEFGKVMSENSRVVLSYSFGDSFDGDYSSGISPSAATDYASVSWKTLSEKGIVNFLNDAIGERKLRLNCKAFLVGLPAAP